MTDQTELFTANLYFNGDVINKRLGDASKEFGYYLNEDALSYLVNATKEEKRKDFRAFIAGGEGLEAMDAIMDVMLWARFLREHQRIEASILYQDELLTSYIQDGWKRDQIDSSEDSYW